MVRKVSVLTADGRTVELRIRSRRRVAVRANQLPNPRLGCTSCATGPRLS